jgi:phosphatidate cytidylyltransferase
LEIQSLVMHFILYYIPGFILLAGIGMALANRKVSKDVKRQRWLKFSSYICITAAVLLSLFYQFFPWVAIGIAVVAMIEVLRAKSSWRAILIFLLIATGFIFFSVKIDNDLQLLIYFQVIVFDAFCQIAGQLFGKSKIAPVISPAKTWEGFSGGLIFCCIATLLMAKWDYVWQLAIVMSIFTSFASLSGDLLASWNKRNVMIKDYSHWLPGQGGFLDRFDSFIMTGAFYYLLYILLFYK